MTRPLSPPRRPNSLWRIFRWPLALALASVVGLLSALLGDGWADALSWALLGGLLVIIAAAWWRGR